MEQLVTCNSLFKSGRECNSWTPHPCKSRNTKVEKVTQVSAWVNLAGVYCLSRRLSAPATTHCLGSAKWQPQDLGAMKTPRPQEVHGMEMAFPQSRQDGMASLWDLTVSLTPLLSLKHTGDPFTAIALITAFSNSPLPLPRPLNPVAVY